MDGKRTKDEESASYREGYERDVVAWEARLAEMDADGTDKDSKRYKEAKEAHANAVRLLKESGGGQKGASKRPAGRAKATR